MKLVREIASYVEANGGPDPEGRAHHRIKKVPLAEVQAAIEVIQGRGELLWLKSYHVSPVPNGCWQEQRLVDEVLKRKCDALLREGFGGDLTRFCCEVTGGQLLSPLIETHDGREISVSMGALARVFGSSPYAVVQRYLQILDEDKNYVWFKPYHMTKASLGTWKEREIVDEVLQKKCDLLLRDCFDNDLTRFCCEVKADQLRSPLIETHDGREISVSMVALCRTFGSSRYAVVQRYLQIREEDRNYTWFKPYHMTTASRGTWKQQEMIDEVLKKKCDSLLRDYFDSDLTRFCCEVTADQLLSPLIETHKGREISVSMAALVEMLSDSGYAVVQRYLQIREEDRNYTWFKPYHMTKAPQGTWKEREIVDEVLKKKCDSLLRDCFDNDLIRFCCEVTQDQLRSPLIETHDGKEISVSMGGVVNTLRNSPYEIARRYLEILGEDSKYTWFKPYHMHRASTGVWEQQEVIDEVLKKKCDSLLRDYFDNDLTRFCCEVTHEQLGSTLIETHNGREISVSMRALVQVFGHSRYAAVQRYLQIREEGSKYTWFKPYHMTRASLGTWEQREMIDEVLKKKCDSLLRDCFDNDLIRFCCEVTRDQLRSPLIETHDGREMSVSVMALINSFKGSPYLMTKHYHKLLGRLFPYTPECFIGTPETRKRRQSGELSTADLKKIRLPDGTLDTKRYGFKNFVAADKAAVRQFMVEIIEDTVKDRSVNYLGLETEQFLSLRALYERVNLSPTDSLVVEQDGRTFKAMTATVKGLANGEGRALRKVDLRNNQIESELEVIPDRSFQFNVVNLDYLGHMSQSKEFCLQLLLEKRLLDNEALVFITLQDNELAQARAAVAGYAADQASAVDKELLRLADLTGHKAQRLAWLHYEGGSGGKGGAQMLWLAYKVTREEIEGESEGEDSTEA